MMATYFRAVPREIFEAATLDGASCRLLRHRLPDGAQRHLHRRPRPVLLHLERPADRADLHQQEDLRTIQVGLLNFTGEFGSTQYGPLFAAICINVFGILLIYLFLNQKVMKGLTAGAVKG